MQLTAGVVPVTLYRVVANGDLGTSYIATGAHPSELNREVPFGAEVMSDPSGASAELRNRPRSKADLSVFGGLRALKPAFEKRRRKHVL